MLDPSRYALDAATVGFRKRMGLSVDWGAFNNAIQNQTDAIKVRRELEETAITELHVMGGERYGIAGNEKTNTAARQARQMQATPTCPAHKRMCRDGCVPVASTGMK